MVDDVPRDANDIPNMVNIVKINPHRVDSLVLLAT